MFGLMQDRPLLISSLIDYAANFHPHAEVVGRCTAPTTRRYSAIPSRWPMR
jgi:fatty-acyl-CoA synthase